MQRERLDKLLIQAVLNVSHNNDEFIKEFLISHNKVVQLASRCIMSCMITTIITKIEFKMYDIIYIRISLLL